MPQALSQEQLIRAISDMGPHYAAILFGAGASKTSLIPIAKEIVIDLCRESYCEVSGISLNLREHVRAADVRQWLQMQAWFAKARERGESEYSAVFRQFKPTLDHQITYIRKLCQQAKPSVAYAGLAHLVRDGFFDIALTTNFDPLFENRYKSIFSVEVLDILKDDHGFRLATADTARRQLLYLHGSLDSYSIANLDEHTQKLGKESEAAITRMMDGYVLVVVGYSGTDSSVMGLLRRLAGQHPSCFRRGVVYWCHLPAEKPGARAMEFLNSIAQGFLVEIYGFDHLISTLCRKLNVGCALLEAASPARELTMGGKLLPDQAALNLAAANQLPANLFKYRTRLKNDDELVSYRDRNSRWQATVKGGFLWLLGDPAELPAALLDACSLTPEPHLLSEESNSDLWNVFAELANAGLRKWLVENLSLRESGGHRPRYFFPKLPDRDSRKLRYRSRRKCTQRDVVWLEFERGTEEQRTRFYGHEAVRARIIRFQSEPALWIAPTRLFTVEGKDVWTGPRAGVSIARQIKSIWNIGYDALVRMWLDCFADGSERIIIPLTSDARKKEFCFEFNARPYPASRVPA